MKKKILIVTYYWSPSGGSGVQRWVKFTKYLPRFGIDPVVLTVSNPTYASLDDTLEDDIPETTRVYKSTSFEPFGIYSLLSGKSKSEVAKPSTRIGSGTSLTVKMASWFRANIFVPDARIGWLPSARKQALRLIKEHDIRTVITTGPPHSAHLIGRYVKKHKSVKWIADFRDPWTMVFYNQLLPRTQLVKNIDLRLEKSVLESADEVIVVSPSMEKLQKRIVDRSYHIISNGFDPEDFTFLKDQNGENEDFTIRHIGTLSESAIPKALFKALEMLPTDFSFRLEFIGNVHEQVRELIQQSRIRDRVVFRNYLPHSEAVRAMASSDLLLLVIPDVRDNELILTGKIFEYVATGRPILMIGPKKGDAAAVLDDLGHGQCFDYDEVQGMASYLENTMSRHHNSPLPIRNLGQHTYSRIRQTEYLAGLIN